MRYKKALAVLFLILLTAVPCAFGEEDSALEITAAVEPQEMVSPGEAEVTVTVTNTSGEAVRGVTVSSYDGLTTVEVGEIAPGETRTVTRSHSVTEAELAQGRVVYTVSYASRVNPGATVNHMVSAYVVRAIAAPEAEFTRVFSSTLAPLGGTVTAVYRVTNTGNEPLTDLRVLDALGDFSGRADRLGVGESLLFVNWAVVTEDCASTASLTYGAPSLDAPRTLELTGVEIRASYPVLQLTLSAEERDGGWEATLGMRNGGEVALYDLRVYDVENGGLLFDGLALAPGAAYEVSRVLNPQDAPELRWRVEAVTETGEPVSGEAVCALPGAEAGAEPLLTLTARAAAEELRDRGGVRVVLTLLCAGSDAKDVRVTEQNLGEIRTFAVVPGGVAVTREVLVPVEEETTFRFAAEYRNSAGGTVVVAAAPVTVRITLNGAEPEPLPGEEAIWLRGISRTLGGTDVYSGMLLGVGAVLLVLVVILGVRSRRDKQKRRRQRRQKKEDADV